MLEPGTTALEMRRLLSEDEYSRRRRTRPDSFTAKIGAEAIRDMLSELDSTGCSLTCAPRSAVRSDAKKKPPSQDRRGVPAVRQLSEWMIPRPGDPPDLRPSFR